MNYLTSVQETDMQIMIRLDIESLEKFCFISQDAYNICNNPFFWQLKFEYDQLPILEQQVSLTGWIDYYNVVELMDEEIKLILYIHYIEATRKHDPLNMIILAINDHEENFNMLHKIFKQEIKGEFLNLIIQLDNNQYKLIIEQENGKRKYETYTDKKTVYDLMMVLNFYGELDEILDQLSIEFIIPYNRNISNYTTYEKKIINKRFGIRDCYKK